ncbi:MAG: rhomboid family intramembrane serine protease [Promethearchaeota archaeon]
MVYEVKNDNIPMYKQYMSMLIIAACVIVMILQFLSPDMLINFAFVPEQFFRGEPWGFITMFTSMFLHGDLVHLIMNMWFFYVVADNCEKALGHIGFLLTYIGSGLFASFLHAMTSIIASFAFPDILSIPCLGASGAIFGMIGVYSILFPKTQLALLSSPLTGSVTVSRRIKASQFIALYLIAEVSYGIYSLIDPLGAGQTAHFAHVGGFVVGAIVAFIYKAYKEIK